MNRVVFYLSILSISISSISLATVTKAQLDGLVAGMQSDDPNRCSQCAIKLCEYGPKARAVIPDVLEMLRKEKFNFYANEIFPYVAIEEPVENIVKLTNDDSPHVQTCAMEALKKRKIDKEQAVTIYSELLNHGNPFVRLEAIQALNQIGAGKLCLDTAIELAHHENTILGGMALTEIEKIGITNEIVRKLLIESFDHKDKRESVKAALIYQRLYPQETQGINRIKELLSDKDRNVRWHAVRAIGNLKDVDEESIQLAKNLMDDNDKLVSLRACYAMIKHGVDEKHAWKLIDDSLKSDIFLEIVTPLTVLAELGPLATGYQEKVIRLVNNKDETIQIIAIHTLGEIYSSKKQVLPVLEQKLKTTEDLMVWRKTHTTIDKINSQDN